MGTGHKQQTLIKSETKFWKELIKTYLEPLDTSFDEQEKIKKELTQLRNKVCLSFLLLNALFITIVYTLTEVNKQEEGTLSIPLPCGVPNTHNKGYGQGHIEPISFAFTAVFGIMLFIQFICMLFHRYSTLLHVISTPEAKIDIKTFLRNILCCKCRNIDEAQTPVTLVDALDLVKGLQRPPVNEIIDDCNEHDEENFWKMVKRDTRSINQGTLDRNFIRNFASFQTIDFNKETFKGKHEEEKISFFRNEFGSGLTNRSVKTLISIRGNEVLQEQIKHKAKKRMEQLTKERARLKFQAAGAQVVGAFNPDVANVARQAMINKTLSEHDTEIKTMKFDETVQKTLMADADTLF